MLNSASVLVAEDEPFIALDLALAIEDAGGAVVGPAGSCEEALALLRTTTVAAAILDLNLADGESSAVVALLRGLHVPVILYTGVGIPSALAARFPDLIVRSKPWPAAALIVELETLISRPAD